MNQMFLLLIHGKARGEPYADELLAMLDEPIRRYICDMAERLYPKQPEAAKLATSCDPGKGASDNAPIASGPLSDGAESESKPDTGRRKERRPTKKTTS